MIKYCIGDKEISFINNKKKISYLSSDDYTINMLESPYVSTRYVPHTWDINDNVIINLYSCDYNQLDFKHEVYQYFTLRFILDGNETYHRIKSGEYSLDIGKQDAGEHWFIIQVIDKSGRKSHELYNEFRVIDKVVYDEEIANNTYNVTDEDLKLYGISKFDDESVSLQTKQGLQKMFFEKAEQGIRKLILPNGIYQIETEVQLADGWLPEDHTDEELSMKIQYNKNVLHIPNNFILDLNGSTIKEKTTPYWQNVAFLIAIDSCYDSHIVNGTLEGDYRRRSNEQRPDGSPSKEGGACCTISGKSRYCSFEDITVTKFTGYCTTLGMSPNISKAAETVFGLNFKDWTNITIDNLGNEAFEEHKWTSDYFSIPSILYEKDLVRIGQYLGNGWNPQGDSWNTIYSFYDENKRFISQVNGYQYREFIKPSHSRYIRATYYCKTTDTRPNVNDYLTKAQHMLIYYYIPRNCEIKRLHFVDTRTCGLNPNQANNCLIEGCTFTDCATNITPVAVDFEDGWYLMQDYCFRKNEVLKPVGTGDLVLVGGMNIIVEENKNFRTVTQGNFGVGFLFRNNKDNKRLVYKNTRLNYEYNKVENEHFGTQGYFTCISDSPLVAKNFEFFESSPNAINGYYLNAKIDFNNWVNPVSYGVVIAPGGKYVNSTILNFTGFNSSRTKITNCEYINSNFSNFNGIINGQPSIMDNCTINNFKTSYDNFNGNLIIKNSNINTFHCSYIGTWSPILEITLENCIIDNSNSTSGVYVFTGNFHYITHTNFKFTFKNCRFVNGTKIANDTVLNNTKITWVLEGNVFN